MYDEDYYERHRRERRREKWTKFGAWVAGVFIYFFGWGVTYGIMLHRHPEEKCAPVSAAAKIDARHLSPADYQAKWGVEAAESQVCDQGNKMRGLGRFFASVAWPVSLPALWGIQAVERGGS